MSQQVKDKKLANGYFFGGRAGTGCFLVLSVSAFVFWLSPGLSPGPRTCDGMGDDTSVGKTPQGAVANDVLFMMSYPLWGLASPAAPTSSTTLAHCTESADQESYMKGSCLS